MSDSATTIRHKMKAELERSVMAILLDEKIPETKPSMNPDETRTLIIDDLVPYAAHPFKLYEGARLNDMVRSIKENGVIVPIVTRPLNLEEDTYEILSGHNRVNAAKLVGLTKVPAIVKENLSDDEARYIRLSFLTTGLLSRVDSGEIGLYTAVK